MQKHHPQMPEIKLVGIKVRTNNQAEWDPLEQPKFHPVFNNIFTNNGQTKFNQNPGTTFCAYTDYESDYTGEYTFYIGEEVSSMDGIPEGLDSHIIPPQTYIKFTASPSHAKCRHRCLAGTLENVLRGFRRKTAL